MRYSIRGPASGNTSLPDVDSSRFAGCTSGARTVTSSRGLLGASWGPLGGLLGVSFCLLGTSLGPLPPPSFSYTLPIFPSNAGSNHGRRSDQLPPGWRCAAVRPGEKSITLQSLCGLLGASLGSLGGFLGTSWRPLGGFLGPLGGLFGASSGPLGGVLGRLGALLRRFAPSETVWGASRGRLGALLGSFWAVLGAFWTVLAASLGRLGAILEAARAVMASRAPKTTRTLKTMKNHNENQLF